MFYAKISKGNNPPIYLDLFLMSSVAIVRHVKIRKEATPFDPRFTEYFKQRDCCQNKTKPSAKYAATNLRVAQSKCVKLAGSTDVGL
jgi:RNA-directed DNA polymerase